jgi:hypothetical protein
VQKMLKVSAWHLSQSKLGEGEQRFRSPLQQIALFPHCAICWGLITT